MKKLRVYFYVQDNCEICNKIKEEFDLKAKSLSFLQNIPINKVYPVEKTIKKYQITHTPTLIITSFIEEMPNIEILEYKTVGFISKKVLVELLSSLKKGAKLSTPLFTNTGLVID